MYQLNKTSFKLSMLLVRSNISGNESDGCATAGNSNCRHLNNSTFTWEHLHNWIFTWGDGGSTQFDICLGRRGIYVYENSDCPINIKRK